MKHWSFIVAVVLLLTLGCDPPPAEANLLQLCQQIDFYKKFKYSIGCLEFADYGCYCGPGGWGSPADSADACCMRHDKCYDQAKDLFTHCYPYVEYYNHKNGTCFDEQKSCRRFVCDCDQALARCLRSKRYNSRFINYRYSGHCKWSGNIKDLI